MDLFESADPHMAAVLIKMFLRELPEPLLTFEAYSKVMGFGSKRTSILGPLASSPNPLAPIEQSED